MMANLRMGDVIEIAGYPHVLTGGDAKNPDNWKPIDEISADFMETIDKARKMEKNRPQEILKAKQYAYKQQPFLSRLSEGVGQAMTAIPGAMQMRQLVRGDNIQDQRKESMAVSQGDVPTGIGQYGTEILELGPTLAGLAKAPILAGIKGVGKRLGLTGLAQGGVSSEYHKASAASTGEEYTPMQQAGELLLSGLAPAGVSKTAGKASAKLAEQAPEFVQAKLKPALKYDDFLAVNPPDYKWALENKIIQTGADEKKTAENVMKMLKQKGAQRRVLLEQASKGETGARNYSVDIRQAAENARVRALKEFTDEQGNMTPQKIEEAIASIDNWEKTALKYPTGVNAEGKMTPSRATSFRMAIDDDAYAKAKKLTDTPGDEYAGRILRDEIETQIKSIDPEIRKLTEEMGKLTPLKDVLIRAAHRDKNNFKMGLLPTVIATGAVGSLSGGSGVGAGGLGALGYAGIYGFNELQHNVGTGARLQGLSNVAGKLTSQPGLVRSSLGQGARITFADLLKKEPKKKEK